MALKDILKSLAGDKKQNEIAKKEEAAAALLASDDFPILRASEVDMNRYRKVPLAGLAVMGAAFAQLPESARTMTTVIQKTVNLPETLFVGVNPNGIAGFLRANQYGTVGNIMQINEQGKQVIAGRMRFMPVNQLPVTETFTSVAQVNPLVMAIAVGVMEISQKLDTIQRNTEEILNLIKLDKQTRQRANLHTLTDAMEDYKRDYCNEETCSRRMIGVQQVKKEAYQDILYYQTLIDSHLQEQKKLHVTQDAQKMLERVRENFCEYQLACYLYGFASFMEVMLQKDFEAERIEAVEMKLKKYAEQYSELYKGCRAQLAVYQRSAIEAQILGGLGNTLKAAGEKLASVPVLSKGPVDEALISAGESMGKRNREAVARKLAHIEELEDSRLTAFVESLHTLDVVCNQRDGLLTDGESLYIQMA